ncbi:transposase IS166 family protein [Pseudomonas sp. SJZ101]|nr:transposase IS166 family protein [Pseudomonas sp. SJZ075]TWC26702.1 transposase IS166 family protein [Pseudomonas sp. SJZ078]TWC45841.1 transposase IS166 family protein [Pseudomonas sp. SJZ124]TWC46104.1 transposase IS166 family protein [Pseudomonas sp. SJZ080]TWC81144.1 transposase IS166 family protein [Pseudomonas sp. SJZ101]
MVFLPDYLSDDPVLLKQLLLEALTRQAKTAQVLEAHEGHIVDLNEQIKLLRDCLFGRKSEQTVEPNTPQLALFNEPESEPTLQSAKWLLQLRAVASAGHRWLTCHISKSSTCACGCAKHVIGEETSEQLDIVPM